MSGHNEIQLCWSISSAPFLTLNLVVTLTESYKVNVIESKIIDSFDGFQTALLKLASKEGRKNEKSLLDFKSHIRFY